ncbi:MAG TPA: asparaginase [Rhizomicrobium sp.]|nr:asparaginase [Rhizomicrobium sp.]
MANPVLIEVTRGDRVESIHRGSIAVVDPDGRVVAAIGDIESPVYPRSSLKPVQALPLVESGASDAYGLGAEELALACASHSSEPMHTDRVKAWLARIGCEESDLACGAHPSLSQPVANAMIRAGEKPTRAYNNCSGKHTGFLTLAKHWDIATKGYELHDHPVQRAVAETLGEMTGLGPDMPWGVDGCTAPNFALPLHSLAFALAKMATPSTLPAARGAAAERLIAAMMAHPELVSGTGRTCAILMRACDGKAAVKTGAEGFFAGVIPGKGYGITLKIDDGTGRAADAVMAVLLDKLGLLDTSGEAGEIVRAPIMNTAKKQVGERRASPTLAEFKMPSA